MIKISIIIPVYNKEDYLDRCLQSIFRQINTSNGSFELLIIDDGSTDNSCSIIEKYAKQYDIIVYVSQENSGVSVARNKAIQIASGDYVLFLDADDELIDGALPKVHEYLENSGPVDMLVTRQTRYDGKTEKLVAPPTLIEGQKYNGVEAYRNQYVRLNAGGGICRASFIRDKQILFPKGVRNSEDTIFFGLIQVYADSIVYYDIPLYRIHTLDGSASRVDNTKLAIRHIDTVNAVVKVRNELSCSEERKGIFEFYVFQLISNAMGKYIKSKELGYSDMVKSIDIPGILPLRTQYMHMMRQKATLMNLSFKLYYFVNWLKINFIQKK